MSAEFAGFDNLVLELVFLIREPSANNLTMNRISLLVENSVITSPLVVGLRTLAVSRCRDMRQIHTLVQVKRFLDYTAEW